VVEGPHLEVRNAVAKVGYPESYVVIFLLAIANKMGHHMKIHYNSILGQSSTIHPPVLV
jgi:hypothetical protein